MDITRCIIDFQRGGFLDLRDIEERDAEVPLHYSPFDHVYVILDGTMECAVDHQPVIVGVGEYLYIPAGRLHRRRVGSAGCRYLRAKRVW